MPDALTLDRMRRRRLALLPLLALVVVAGAPAAAAAAPPPSTVAAPSARTAASAAAAPAPGWVWPLDAPRRVLRPFVTPPTPYAAGHRGVDLAASSAGAEVLAATSGVVHFAGRVVDRGVVTIRSGHLLITVEPVSPAVAAGDVVSAGEALGLLESGHCASPCLHVGVREAGEYVSPLRWLGGLPRAVLLPLGGDA